MRCGCVLVNAMFIAMCGNSDFCKIVVRKRERNNKLLLHFICNIRILSDLLV